MKFRDFFYDISLSYISPKAKKIYPCDFAMLNWAKSHFMPDKNMQLYALQEIMPSVKLVKGLKLWDLRLGKP